MQKDNLQSLSCLEEFRNGNGLSHDFTTYPNSKGGLTVWCNTHMCVVAECVAHE